MIVVLLNLKKGGSFMTQNKKGILCMLASVLLFSFMQLFISMTGPDTSVFHQIFFRNLLGMILCIYFIRRDHLPYFGDLKSQPYLLGRSLFGFLGLLFLFYATRHASLADVTIVSKTGPFFTTLVAILFLHERLSPVQILALVIIFFGGWLVTNPRFDSAFIPLGVALLSAICNGICYPLLRYSKEKEHAMTVIMHFSTFCVVVCIPFLLVHFSIPHGMDIFYLALVAITGALGQIFLTYAYRLSPASEVSVYEQFSVVCSILLGYFFLHQIPSLRSMLGGVLIVGTSVFVYFYNLRRTA